MLQTPNDKITPDAGEHRRSFAPVHQEAVLEAAARTIERTEIIRLSVEGQRAFAQAILNPPAPSAGLKKAARTSALAAPESSSHLLPHQPMFRSTPTTPWVP